MKLDRLVSSTQRPARESIERLPHAADERIRRVDALEGVEPDRQRSLQQELSEVESGAIGAFKGGERVLEEVRSLASQVAALGQDAGRLIKAAPFAATAKGIDEMA